MMKKVLITGKNSYIGTSVEKWLLESDDDFTVDTVDTMNDNWKNADFGKYDVVFHVAGIAHVNAKKSMEALYYKVNRDLTIEIAKYAKKSGVKQFIFMSSMIVFHESKSLTREVITKNTKPEPNGFYGNSKLQAENGLHKLDDEQFRVVILRPPMIYGPNSKGNFMRLIKLARITPVFPAYHNKRSMLYIDNLCEFIKQIIIREKSGVFYPQNNELADTVEIVKYFAKAYNHKIFMWKWLNIFVHIGSLFLNSINKMFATYYYDPNMSIYPFEYIVCSQEKSFEYVLNNNEDK